MPARIGDEVFWLYPSLADTAGDQSENGRNGTYHGGMGTVGDTGNGGVRAYSFDGVNDCLSLAAINLSGTAIVTLSAWIWKSSFANSDTPVFELSTNQNLSTVGAWFCVDSGAPTNGMVQVALRGNANYNARGFTRPSVGWRHYVAEWDKSQTSVEVRLWIDGVLRSPVEAPFTENNTNNFGNVPMFFGARNNSILFFAGRMDDLRLFSRVLTSGEIAALSANRTPATTRVSMRGGFASMNGGFVN
jgi:hypothetical protein